jgi:hypothetical protein
VHRRERRARATVKTAAAFLPRREGRIMAETWVADLDHADELGIDHRDIARGAVAFAIRRGPLAWCRRRGAQAPLIALALLVTVAFVPPWLVIPTVALGLLVWLIASPTRADSEPGTDLKSSHSLPKLHI